MLARRRGVPGVWSDLKARAEALRGERVVILRGGRDGLRWMGDIGFVTGESWIEQRSVS